MRLALFFLCVPATLLVFGLSLWAEADAIACSMWEDGRLIGQDSRDRLIAATWEQFGQILGNLETGQLMILISLHSSPVLFPALGVLLVEAHEIARAWIAVLLSALLWVLLLADPSSFHDCEQEADTLFVIVPLGLWSGLCILAALLLLPSRAKSRG